MSSIHTNSQQIKTNSNAMADLELSKVNYEIYTKEKYQEIQQSIFDTTEKIAELEDTLDTLRKRLGYYKAAVAPHKQLPTDILRRIFILSARAYGSVQIPLQCNQRAPASLVLSHVCSPWRQVALGTGELWSDIHISGSLSQDTVDICEFWLKRAGHFLVAVKLGDHYESVNPTVIRKLPCPARVTYLDLRICNHDVARLSTLPDDILPDVREVRLSVKFNSDRPLPSQLPSFFKHTKFLRCYHHLSDKVINDLTLFWSGLRYLDLGDAPITTPQCLYILRQTVSLEMCRLVIIEPESGSMTGETAIHRDEFILPELRILILKADNHSLDAIITSISTPQLMKFSLRGPDYQGLFVEDRIIGILAERLNLWQLEELELFRVWGPFFDVLLRNTSLRHIIFPHWGKGYIPDDLVSELATGNICPCLESIEVPAVHNLDELFELFEMIEVRQGNSTYNKTTPFRYVRTSTRDRIRPYQYEERVAKLRKLGVEIVIDGRRIHDETHVDCEDGDREWSELLVRRNHIPKTYSY
ncbi:hypothetical protein AX17_003848 [Amanita inopinata Kibby_2008]|nr:hypothetical protein AX17_003848 [Amanita inopinata Kibby_2008]